MRQAPGVGAAVARKGKRKEWCVFLLLFVVVVVVGSYFLCRPSVAFFSPIAVLPRPIGGGQ